MPERLDELSRRFREPLLRYYASRVKTPEDAEELVQEVFLRLLRQKDLGEIENIDVFTFVAARSVLKDHYRYKSRHGGGRTTPIEKLQIRSSEPNPGQVVEDRDEIGVLMAAIEELPPKCRAVFTLFRFEDVPQAEIARRLGITVSMVEKHIAAAMVTLKKKLRAAHNDEGSPHD